MSNGVEIGPIYFLIGIALVLIAPLLVDQWTQYRFTKHKLERLNGKVTKFDISKPTPTPALYRTLMTFGVIVLVAAMLLYVLGTLNNYLQPLDVTLETLSNYTNDPNNNLNNSKVLELITDHNNALNDMSQTMVSLIKDVATVLGGALSAIVGFYFGNRATTDTVPEKPTPVSEDETTHTTPPSSPPGETPASEKQPGETPASEKK